MSIFAAEPINPPNTPNIAPIRMIKKIIIPPKSGEPTTRLERISNDLVIGLIMK